MSMESFLFTPPASDHGLLISKLLILAIILCITGSEQGLHEIGQIHEMESH